LEESNEDGEDEGGLGMSDEEDEEEGHVEGEGEKTAAERRAEKRKMKRFRYGGTHESWRDLTVVTGLLTTKPGFWWANSLGKPTPMLHIGRDYPKKSQDSVLVKCKCGFRIGRPPLKGPARDHEAHMYAGERSWNDWQVTIANECWNRELYLRILTWRKLSTLHMWDNRQWGHL
jgi:hypothetical protein